MVQPLKYLFLVALFFLPLTSEAAFVNVIGFETQDTTEAAATSGTLSVTSSSTHSGIFSLNSTPATTNSGTYTIAPVIASGASSFTSCCGGDAGVFGFWFNAAVLPASEEKLVIIGNSLAFVTIQPDGLLGFYDNTPQTGLGTTTQACAADTWCFIEVRTDTNGAGDTEIRINGVSAFSASTNYATGAFDRVTLGKSNMNGNTVNFYYDDFYWTDGTTFLPNAINSKIARIMPNQPGTSYTGFAGGTAAGYAATSDFGATDGDTSYALSSTSADDLVAYEMEDALMRGITGTVQTLKAHTRLRDNVGTASTSAIFLHSGGTTASTTAVDPGFNYLTWVKMFDTDPATGASWTVSGIDGVELGAAVNTANLIAIRLSTVYGMVYYAPAAPSPLLSAFSYCREMTMTAGGDSGGAATTTTLGIPLFASTTISSFAATSSGGRIQNVASATDFETERPVDFIVTSDSDCSFSGGTLLDFFTEKYASTTGEVHFWHRNIDVSSTTAKQVNIYYGLATTTEFQRKSEVFNSLNQRAVFDTSSTAISSRRAAVFDLGPFKHNASTTGDMAVVDGQVGTALQYDGTNDFIQSDVHVMRRDSEMSMMMWVQTASSTHGTMGLISIRAIGDSGANSIFDHYLASTKRPGFRFRFLFVDATNAITANKWHHVVITRKDGTNVGCEIYIDGAADPGSCASSVNTFKNITNRAWTLGRSFTDANSGVFEGSMDDIRWHGVVLDPMDILTTYNNTASSETFWDFGAEETQAAEEGTVNPDRNRKLFMF